jgi:tripartite-type tricarboxylate transporter receptor subunit TctC
MHNGLQSWQRKWLIGAATVVIALGGSAVASAQQQRWPSRQIIIYVGFAVGGYADSVARVVGDQLSKKLGEPVVIQNLDGAGGNIAARQVMTSPADGYSLLATTTALAINATLYKDKGFTAEGLIPIALPAFAPEAIAASNSAKIKSLSDLPTLAKTEKIYLATPGIGSGSQIAQTYFFQKLAKLPFTQIPFSGGGPAMQGVLSGDANLIAATAAAQTVSAIKSDQVVGVAVASAQRDPSIPNVATFAEQGYPDFLASSWVGFFAPKGTSTAIVDKLNKAINEIVQERSVQEIFDRLGAEASIRSASDTKADFDADVARWSTMVNSIGLSL